MWSDKERTIAKQLADEETLAFLFRVFTELEDNEEQKLKENIVALDDAEYGQLMKVMHLTKVRTKKRIDLIRKISHNDVKKDVAKAPR